MDKNNNKKRKNLIQEFLTYTGSDPSTNEIIGFLAIKNAEYLAKNEANHGQFSKEERKDLYEFYNYFAEHFEKQTRDARLKNWGQEPYLFRLTIDLYEWEQQELKILSEELPEKIRSEMEALKKKLIEIPKKKIISCISSQGAYAYDFPAVITEEEREAIDNCFLEIYCEMITCQGVMTVRAIGNEAEKDCLFGIVFWGDGTWEPVSKKDMEESHCIDAQGHPIPPEPNTIYTEIER